MSESSSPRLPADTSETIRNKSARLWFLKHWWVIGLMALLTLGATGAGLKYLEDSAKQQANQPTASDKKNHGSYLSAINPFVLNPTPTPTPQLSKEYIYAGSRMLAVEDKNASAAPPADLAVWRPRTGEWLIMSGASSVATTFPWGDGGDTPVPGDYDGDGKTDFSVWRPSDGTWYIIRSGDDSRYSFTFGQSSDRVAPADYDGDGKTDLAVFRPSDSKFYIRKSSDASFTSQNLAEPGGTPAPADYDGDGKADIAVWRDGNYSFSFKKSSDGVEQLPQAISGLNSISAPVSADYDGDGKSDFAVRNGINWIIRYSSTGAQETIPWQSAGDVAVQNDYDGDGKVDVAVWHAANGKWFIRQSASGNTTREETWGLYTDFPVPAYYRRR